MNAKNFSINDCTKREEIKSLIEIFPAIRIPILFVNFVEETIEHCNVPAFVVSSQQINPVRVFNLETEEEGNRLN